MDNATTLPAIAAPRRARPPISVPLATLARRRFSLTARTPRELVVPLLSPLLLAVVIAPALRNALHASAAYESYVAVGTAGLLIPLNTMFAGIGVIVDREQGAQRELLAAPVPRWLLVAGNLLVALAVTGLQVAVLLAAARLRGVHFSPSANGVLWFLAAAVLLAVAMYGTAETLASRVARQEEYVARVPVIAIVPWFLSGSLFPIGALPVGLTWIARFLPLTHALALMRYGLLGNPSGLHSIWRGSDPTQMAALSLLVVAAFAALLSIVAVRTFTRAAQG
jgi:ABC-2 type transport system permease protein